MISLTNHEVVIKFTQMISQHLNIPYGSKHPRRLYLKIFEVAFWGVFVSPRQNVFEAPSGLGKTVEQEIHHLGIYSIYSISIVEI